MGRSLPVFFDENSEPLDRRIATGLHKLGLAMKQQTWLLANEEGLSPTQGQILSLLSLEGPRSGTEIANKLAVSLPTVHARSNFRSLVVYARDGLLRAIELHILKVRTADVDGGALHPRDRAYVDALVATLDAPSSAIARLAAH